jgi:protease I
MNRNTKKPEQMKDEQGIDEPKIAQPEPAVSVSGDIQVNETLLLTYDQDKDEVIYSKEKESHVTESANVRVGILCEEGFEEVELTSPKRALEDAGVQVDIISPHNGVIRSWDQINWGKEIKVDIAVHEADPAKYDAIVLPGGVMNPDKLRQSSEAVRFLRQFISTGKPVAAICHGAQTLIETGMIAGITMTSYPSLKTDLRNAGVNWVDKEMVHYGQFITSRKPADLNAFNEELLQALLMQGRRAA